MDENQGETWQFTTRCGSADQVYLVVDGPTTPSRWIPMSPVADLLGTWCVAAQISPGQTRVRYFTAEDGAYLNCGTVGLQSQRVSTLDPSVKNKDLNKVA